MQEYFGKKEKLDEIEIIYRIGIRRLVDRDD